MTSINGKFICDHELNENGFIHLFGLMAKWRKGKSSGRSLR